MDAPQWNGDVQDWPSVEDNAVCFWCSAEPDEPCKPYCDCPTCREQRNHSYDQHQRNAKLAQCEGCRRWVYFVNHARVRCAACREGK